MSVFFDHRRRYGDDEQGAIQDRRDDGTLWGFAYDRIEGVVHLTLAFTIVGGAAVVLSSALFSPGAPLGGPVEKPAVARQAPTVASAAREAAAPKEAPAPVPVNAAPAPVAPVQQAEPVPEAPAANPYLDARPMTDSAAPATAASAPEPLAPPSADIREKLVASQDVAPALAAPPVQETAAPPAEANAYQAPAAPAVANLDDAKVEPPPAGAKPAADDSKADAGGRMAKCYLKLSGKVQNSGACRVNHAGESVIFHLPGKPLELAHDRGRVWTATLGGRNLGKVYKNKDAPCWGAKGFYACENG
ncbi:hypothetical protein [Methylocystis parvus]|uniref:hypothetical protein n=1 Tax=Methylocystis parvus TaxID=134 RepID=UPI003C77B6B9